MMRIITGTAKGAKLDTLKGEDITRPTAERVKEGIFSAIQFEVTGRRVLDLFAGTGQLSLEALSRGASFAVMIDESEEAIGIIKNNAKKTKLIQFCKIARLDYSEYLKSVAGKEKFTLVFLDPPYAKNMAGEILKKLTRANILEKGAIVVCETGEDTIHEDLFGLTLYKKYHYGKTFVTLMKFPEESVEEVPAES